MGRRRVWLGVALLMTTISVGGAEAQSPTPLEVAEALLQAFNEHDAATMASLVAPDFELYYFDNDGEAGLAVTGPEALRAEMTEYFASNPSVRTTMTGSISGDRFVAFREQVVGGASSLAVYEIVEAKVRRTWYYPAEPGQ